MFSIGGWLSWQAIRALMPAAPPWLGYGLAIAASAGLIWFHGYTHGSDGKSAAVTAANASCEIRIANTRTAAMQTMADLLDTIQNDPAEQPKTPADELKLCKASKLCRENGK